ncbi:MAG: hypothetical protein DRP45_02645 [Candidatus Zixiibacteriota bacterium]|nr:MAG: hypothetical protein DRP45_02645 [candidate division Zixibacteria bacterium]
MPRLLFFLPFVSAVILSFGLAQLLLLRQLNRVWWEKKWIRRAAWSLPAVGVAFFILLVLCEYHGLRELGVIAGAISAISLILEICLMFSLPISGAIRGAGRLVDSFARRKSGVEDLPTDRTRRLFFKGAAAAVPLATVVTGLGGIGRAFATAKVSKKQFAYEGLEPGLQGLRILHLSDLHLAHYVTLEDLEQTLLRAETLSPDLILITGDIADDLTLLPDALELIAGLRPRLGAYATVGNHEHFRGITEVRRLFSKSPVALLVDEGVFLATGNSSVFVAGINDPIAMHSVSTEFFQSSIALSLSNNPPDCFTILMSHRPDAFPFAARQSVDLTLAGHTHGGQIGFLGRSLLERHLPEKYLWGHYEIDNSQLYTSCGMGHWFPFRLGCPPEAPVIELIKS